MFGTKDSGIFLRLTVKFKFSGTWFDNKMRSVATAIILMGAQLGNYSFVWINTWIVNLNPITSP